MQGTYTDSDFSGLEFVFNTCIGLTMQTGENRFDIARMFNPDHPCSGYATLIEERNPGFKDQLIALFGGLEHLGVVHLTSPTTTRLNVATSDLGEPLTIRALFRAVDTFAQETGYAGGFPTFAGVDEPTIHEIALVEGAVARRITIPELPLPSPWTVLPEELLFALVDQYARKRGYLGGFPTFGGKAVMLQAEGGQRDEVTALELSNPSSLETRLAAMNSLTLGPAMVASLPNFNDFTPGGKITMSMPPYRVRLKTGFGSSTTVATVSLKDLTKRETQFSWSSRFGGSLCLGVEFEDIGARLTVRSRLGTMGILMFEPVLTLFLPMSVSPQGWLCAGIRAHFDATLSPEIDAAVPFVDWREKVLSGIENAAETALSSHGSALARSFVAGMYDINDPSGSLTPMPGDDAFFTNVRIADSKATIGWADILRTATVSISDTRPLYMAHKGEAIVTSLRSWGYYTSYAQAPGEKLDLPLTIEGIPLPARMKNAPQPDDRALEFAVVTSRVALPEPFDPEDPEIEPRAGDPGAEAGGGVGEVLGTFERRFTSLAGYGAGLHALESGSGMDVAYDISIDMPSTRPVYEDDCAP